jgi:hypothetical protein
MGAHAVGEAGKKQGEALKENNSILPYDGKEARGHGEIGRHAIARYY